MRCEELSLSGFIKEMKDVSSGPHPRKFCFVLGAGASKTSGIKSGQELVNIWDRELLERNQEEYLKWKAELKITEDNKYSFYSQYYEKRFKRQPMDGYNFLEKLMEHAKPSTGYYMLSYLLSQTDNNVVITTNFDHLIEDAVNYYTQTIPLVIGHETLSHYVTRQLTRPTIIKIHRDLLFNPANRTDEVEILHDNWKKALNEIFMEYHPIFIGYAGNDNSLMNYLIENSDKFLKGELRFPYWMIYQTEELSGKVLSFLEASEGYFVRHNGFDEVLYLMGAAFDFKMPSKEDFLSDAEKRFQALSNSIDEFTEKLAGGKENFIHENAVTGGFANGTEINQAVQQITGQTELQRMFREALMLDKAGKYNDAISIKQELIKQNPKNARYHYSLGDTLIEAGRYEEALAELQEAVELEPDNGFYRVSVGDLLDELKRYEEALEEKKKAVELEPDKAYYRNRLGSTLVEMGRYEEALKEKKKAVELEPEDAYYHNNLGNILSDLGQKEEAWKEMKKAVELEPEDAYYHNNLGNILSDLGQKEEALKEMKKAVQLEPEHAFYHNSLGNILSDLGQKEEALKEMKKAVELEPEDAYYHNDLGYILSDLGQKEEAWREMKKAVELEPDKLYYQASLAELKECSESESISKI